MIRLILTLCLSMQLPLSAAAETPSALLEQFVGEWRSDGPALGAEAVSTMTWSQALGGKFMRLDYRIDMNRDGKSSVFEGVGYYQLGDGETIRGNWADNFGDMDPISATREGDALVSIWGVDGGKQGRTRYELLPSGEMQVTDWVINDGDWRQFNQNTYQRISD